MTFAKSERAALCDLLEARGPAAPTLCEGWSTHDLAAHLWLRETDPIAASGMVARPLAGLLDRRMAEVRRRWPYAELVDRLRRGPARFSVFAIPGVDEPANAIEFFVHYEDVRRAGDRPLPPRELGAAVEDWMWRRLALLGRALFRRARVGVVLERAGLPGRDEPQAIRAASGARIVTAIGKPSELTLFAYGRHGAAAVSLIGEPEAIDLLHGSDLSI